jgi:hypothetical protein
LQGLQDPSKINGDNLNNTNVKLAGISGRKNRQYLKYKIDELAANSKNKNTRDLYRGINGFKSGDQPTNKLVKDTEHFE